MGVRKYPDVPRIYVDMDGPLADFWGACVREGMEPDQFKLCRGIFERLPIVPGAVEAIHTMRAMPVDVWLLTKAADGNVWCHSEKRIWQQRVFPELGDHIIITPDKGCIGRPRDTLIDDHPQWANANNFPGNIITFVVKHDSRGNHLSNNWPEVLESVRTNYNF